MESIIIGVCGGTASGKTTVSNAILERVGADRIAYIQHDAYYRDLSHLPLAERARMNFDHPDALETELLIEHLRQLQAGQAVEVPCYDFTTYVRSPCTRRVEPRRVILIEGILLLVDKGTARHDGHQALRGCRRRPAPDPSLAARYQRAGAHP